MLMGTLRHCPTCTMHEYAECACGCSSHKAAGIRARFATARSMHHSCGFEQIPTPALACMLLAVASHTRDSLNRDTACPRLARLDIVPTRPHLARSQLARSQLFAHLSILICKEVSAP